MALKAFSVSASTRRLYRTLGNRFRLRGADDIAGYVRESAWIVSRAGDISRIEHAAEVGTGWMHFYGIAMALAGIPSIDLYDVWDNRQFLRAKAAFSNFDQHLSALAVCKTEQPAALRKLAAIAAAQNWSDIYESLGLSYSLGPVAHNRYDLVFSMDVVEHVYAHGIRSFIGSIYDALKPGGLSLHTIGLDDHLTHYDPSASQKQFLAFTDRQWRWLYENRVQYFNRIGYGELRSMFREAGFEEIECKAYLSEHALDGMLVAPQFRSLPKEDLLATRARFAHRKPV